MDELLTPNILSPEKYEATKEELLEIEMNNIKLILIKDSIKAKFDILNNKQVKTFISNINKFRLPCMDKINLPVFRIGAYTCVVTLINPDEKVSWPNILESFVWGVNSFKITHIRKLAGIKGLPYDNVLLKRQSQYENYKNNTFSREESIKCLIELLMYCFYIYLNVDDIKTNTLEQLQENLLLPMYQLDEMIEELTK